MKRSKTMPTEAKSTMTPKLRFPEFRNAAQWTTTTLGEISHFSSGGTPPKNNSAYWNGSIPWISASSMYETRIRTSELNVTDEAIGNGTRIAPKGSLLILVRGSMLFNRVPIGIAAIDVAFNQDVKALALAPNVIGEFLLHQLLAAESRIPIDSTGIGAGKIETEALAQFDIGFPSSAEQQKIAECLSTLDELIGAESRKLDALKAHKKGLMQQLFPREGENLPHLRFPEFENAPEWEEMKLGSVGEVLMCKRVFASETNDRSGVPFYKIGTLGGTPDAYINQELFEDYRARYNFPRIGEVLITCSGTVGKCLPYDGRDAYYQDSNIVWIENPTRKVSNEFLLRILSRVGWATLNSTTITRIYGPDLKGLVIRFPKDSAEQQRIASCLSSLDELIATQNEKLSSLRTHKQGLMQQLFPSPVEAEG